MATTETVPHLQAWPSYKVVMDRAEVGGRMLGDRGVAWGAGITCSRGSGWKKYSCREISG